MHGVLPRPDWQISIDQGALACASVISIGNEAARILYQYKHGHVLAVFARSFYVQCEQHVVCIGVASLGRGPLHVLLNSECDVLPFKVVSGVSIDLNVNSLEGVGCAVADAYGSAKECQSGFYSGKVVGRPSVSGSLQPVKEALNLIEPPQQPGFGWITADVNWQLDDSASLALNTGAGSGINDGLIKHSLAALTCLYCWLEGAGQTPGENFHDALSPVPVLLGAGPGLTPSGDDLLAGVMLALHRLQRADIADALWQVLEPRLLQRTNIISGAHLRWAAMGHCSEPVLSLLDYVFDNNSAGRNSEVEVIASNIQSLANSIGASSGWDMLAGMILVLRS